jgi:TetR/AcrR family transcriptional regulator, mexJK operon transcriptional repressor
MITDGTEKPDAGRPATKSRQRGRPALDAGFQRDRIMTAATQIFIERGFTASSVDAIGRAAGVTKRTIYELIGDKEALFHAVCARMCATAGTFHFNVAASKLPLRDMLMDMADTILASSLAPAATAFNRMLAVEALRFPNLVVSVMNVGRHEMHEKIAGVFAVLVARGRVAPIDPSQAADTFYDAIVGSRAMRAMLGYNESYPPVTDIEARVDMIIRGFLKPDPGTDASGGCA